MHARERGVRAVVVLTAVMMVVEIVAGYVTGSMALLADGWHMATHVLALGLTSAGYAVARRFASHRAFAFGTGKVETLAGFTSAVALSLVALTMIVESGHLGWVQICDAPAVAPITSEAPIHEARHLRVEPGAGQLRDAAGELDDGHLHT